MKRYLLILAGALVGAALIAGFFLFLLMRMQKGPELPFPTLSDSESEPVVAGSSFIDTLTVDTSSWKLHEDKELGISLKYPRGADMFSFADSRVISARHPGGKFGTQINISRRRKGVEISALVPPGVKIVETNLRIGAYPVFEAHYFDIPSGPGSPERLAGVVALFDIDGESFVQIKSSYFPNTADLEFLVGVVHSFAVDADTIVLGPVLADTYFLEYLYDKDTPLSFSAAPTSARLIYYDATGRREVILEDVLASLSDSYPDAVTRQPQAVVFFQKKGLGFESVQAINNLLFLRVSKATGGTDALFPVVLYSFNVKTDRIQKLNPEGVTVYWNAFTFSPDNRRVVIEASEKTPYDRLLVLNLETGTFDADVKLSEGETLVFSASELGGHYYRAIRWLDADTLQYKVYVLPAIKEWTYAQDGKMYTYSGYDFQYRFNEIQEEQGYNVDYSPEESLRIKDWVEIKYAKRIELLDFK